MAASSCWMVTGWAVRVSYRIARRPSASRVQNQRVRGRASASWYRATLSGSKAAFCEMPVSASQRSHAIAYLAVFSIVAASRRLGISAR